MKRPRRLVPLLLVAVAAAASTASPPAASPPEEYFNLMGRADSAIAVNDFARADTLLCRAIALQPGNPSNALLMSNLGMVRFALGLDSLAIATLDAANALAPRSTTVLRNRARVLTAAGLTARAAADYETLMALDSTDTRPLFHHGMLALRDGDVRRAADDFARLHTLDPDGPDTHVALASLAMTTGDYTAADRHYTAVLRVNPMPEYYAGRALCRLLTDRTGDAADDIARGLELDPLDPTLHLYRAMLNRQRYRPDDADADARRALELGADPAEVAPLLLNR